MNKDPIVSIIIPAYNVGLWLSKCIDSCIQQTYRNLEIIAINDGSTDDTLNILEKYKKIDSRIRIFSKSNGGINSAIKIGLENLNGEYFTFCDGDDFLDKGLIKYLLTTSLKYDTEIVVSGIRFLNYPDLAEINRFEYPNKTIEREQYFNLVLDGNTNTLCGKLYKSKLLKDNLLTFINTVVANDLVLTIQLALKIKKARLTEEIFYNYVYNRMGSITIINKEFSINKKFVSFHKLFTTLLAKKSFNHFHNEIYNWGAKKIYIYLHEVGNRNTKVKMVKEINNHLYMNRKEIKGKQFRIMLWLIKFNVPLAIRFIRIAQKWKPTIKYF